MALIFWRWIVLDVTIFRPRSRWSGDNGYSMTVWNAGNGPCLWGWQDKGHGSHCVLLVCDSQTGLLWAANETPWTHDKAFQWTNHDDSWINKPAYIKWMPWRISDKPESRPSEHVKTVSARQALKKRTKLTACFYNHAIRGCKCPPRDWSWTLGQVDAGAGFSK